MKTSKAMVIDDKTKISLYAVACSLPFLVGAILWLTSIDEKASAAQSELQSARVLLQKMDERLSRIEGALGTNK